MVCSLLRFSAILPMYITEYSLMKQTKQTDWKGERNMNVNDIIAQTANVSRRIHFPVRHADGQIFHSGTQSLRLITPSVLQTQSHEMLPLFLPKVLSSLKLPVQSPAPALSHLHIKLPIHTKQACLPQDVTAVFLRHPDLHRHYTISMTAFHDGSDRFLSSVITSAISYYITDINFCKETFFQL